MLLTRLYLRNYRVYEDELDVALPPGLVGIYGANGAGKSTLLEAIGWTLFGRARTGKEEIRSAGVGGDCVTELEFEHEGHLYLVRRTLTGLNATVRAEAHCDGLGMSEGVTDTRRYVHSVLGMDDAAFRASVFAEQKQLAAFSNQSPAERRRLVLQLLGITPLDGARDAARKDARTTREHHQRLRSMLPDLDQLRVDAGDADARAGAAEAIAAAEHEAAAVAEQRAAESAEAFARLDQVRQEYDALVIEGRAARQELDSAAAQVAELSAEMDELAEATARLQELQPLAARVDETAHELAGLEAMAVAVEALGGIELPAEPDPPDEAGLHDAQQAAARAREALAAAQSLHEAAAAELRRAEERITRSSALSGEADCPLCGQALGAAFAQVQAHRDAELAEMQRRTADLSAARDRHQQTAQATADLVTETVEAVQAAQRRRQVWEQVKARYDAASLAVEHAHAELAARSSQLAHAARSPDELHEALAARREEVRLGREAAVAAERLQGRLERRSTVEASLAAARDRAGGAEGRVQTLRDKVRALAFDRTELEAAAQGKAAAADAAAEASRAAQRAAVAAAEERARAQSSAQRLADGEAQHAKLADLESEARHLARVADLLSEFRNTVVASVGPRLAAQAAELFGELTDREYDELSVDPESFELQISDAGRVYGLDRFSGSEVDLANLALRVAISEHIRFQSGGTVGLLVLDEVFGPLDEDRKERMLLALTRLGGRFRQILVVTHDAEIKEQLPNALEVVKRPGRRATARLLAG